MKSRRTFTAVLLTTTMIIAVPVFAQTAPAEDVTSGDDIIVTAQKRYESLQNVPISIQALNTKKLDQLNVTNFKDRKSTRLNSSHRNTSRMPSSA